MKIPKTILKSPILQSCFFQDRTFIKLLQLKTPLNGFSFLIYENTSSPYNRTEFLMNEEKAKLRFSEMIQNNLKLTKIQ